MSIDEVMLVAEDYSMAVHDGRDADCGRLHKALRAAIEQHDFSYTLTRTVLYHTIDCIKYLDVCLRYVPIQRAQVNVAYRSNRHLPCPSSYMVELTSALRSMHSIFTTDAFVNWCRITHDFTCSRNSVMISMGYVMLT